jgi:tRNA (guanine37-N1)-methyltransferase
MRIDIFCLFPEMLNSPFDQSIIKRAKERGMVDLVTHNIRDYTYDKHHTVDDYSYGAGPGMVLKPEPIFEAVQTVKEKFDAEKVPVILLTPQGRLLTQQVVQELAGNSHLMIICGHYEGLDERVREHLATDEISIGDYVLSAGEIAAMVVVDAVVRVIPGVLGSQMSVHSDSYSDGLLEYPQYTRPKEYQGWSVPSVLLSGNHSEITRWRRQQAILRTLRRRPDLLAKLTFTDEEKKWISEDLSNLK